MCLLYSIFILKVHLNLVISIPSNIIWGILPILFRLICSVVKWISIKTLAYIELDSQ